MKATDVITGFRYRRGMHVILLRLEREGQITSEFNY